VTIIDLADWQSDILTPESDRITDAVTLETRGRLTQ